MKLDIDSDGVIDWVSTCASVFVCATSIGTNGCLCCVDRTHLPMSSGSLAE